MLFNFTMDHDYLPSFREAAFLTDELEVLRIDRTVSKRIVGPLEVRPNAERRGITVIIFLATCKMQDENEKVLLKVKLPSKVFSSF